MKTLKLISVIILLFTIACSEDSPTSPEKTVNLNGQTYSNGIIGFEITAPEDWILQTNQNVEGIQTLLIGTKSKNEGVTTSFNVISGDANGMKTATELVNSSRDYIAKTFPSVTFEELQTKNINGFDCGELVYSFSYNGVNLKQKQLLFLCGNKVSVAVTFTAGKYNYNSVQNDFNLITNSLKTL